MPTKLEARISKLEEIVTKHLEESGFIRANLKWNTTITSGIAVTLIAKLILDLFKK